MCPGARGAPINGRGEPLALAGVCRQSTADRLHHAFDLMLQGRLGQRHELFAQPKAYHPVGGGKDCASEKMAFVRREPWAETAEGLFDVAKQANLLLQVP